MLEVVPLSKWGWWLNSLNTMYRFDRHYLLVCKHGYGPTLVLFSLSSWLRLLTWILLEMSNHFRHRTGPRSRVYLYAFQRIAALHGMFGNNMAHHIKIF